MYDIIHTKAIVLLDRVEREYDKVFFLFTEELGLVSVTAVSILKPGAKLTSMLQPLSMITCDIVVGKSTKRITTILEKQSYETLFLNIDKKNAFLAIFNFVIRMVPRNIAVKDVYGIFSDFIYTLDSLEHDKEKIQELEVRTLYTILAVLGYIEIDSTQLFDHIENYDYKTMHTTVNNVLRQIQL
jgi:recombinational DNA repair protein (RecF pathway)